MADLRSDEFMNHALRDWEDMVYRLALSQTREPADASDVCQETFISLLKDTSLVATITVHEIFQTAQAINAVKFQPLLLYIEAAFVYLIFSTVLTQIQGMLEKKLGKHLVDTRV